jgi:hypothetical protein
VTSPEARKKRELELLRQLRTMRVLLVMALVLWAVAVVLQKATNDKLDARQSDQHAAVLHACQLGNLRWQIVNQRIVAPIRDVLSRSGDRRDVREFRTIPFNNCTNLYPTSGDPVPPFFRHAALPPLLSFRKKGGGLQSSPNTGSQLPGAAALTGLRPPRANRYRHRPRWSRRTPAMATRRRVTGHPG